MTRSYSPPTNGPLSDDEIAAFVRDHFERNKDNLDGRESK